MLERNGRARNRLNRRKEGRLYGVARQRRWSLLKGRRRFRVLGARRREREEPLRRHMIGGPEPGAVSKEFHSWLGFLSVLGNVGLMPRGQEMLQQLLGGGASPWFLPAKAFAPLRGAPRRVFFGRSLEKI